MLDREEYVEQAHLFRTLGQRLPEDIPLQELLARIGDEVLSTTKLPMALDFMLAELNHTGSMSPAMARLGHYFAAFQTYLVSEAENELGRFDMRIALAVLRYESEYRAQPSMTRQGLFLYQFETLCRNRLSYDRGLAAIAQDTAYDAEWSEWIQLVRRKIGVIEFADLLYVSSEFYRERKSRLDETAAESLEHILFSEREGRIALANRKKDPLFLFAALQRQLGYPVVPRPKPKDSVSELLPQVLRRLERMEVRLKLLEDEQKEGAFDLSKFYKVENPADRKTL